MGNNAAMMAATTQATGSGGIGAGYAISSTIGALSSIASGIAQVGATREEARYQEQQARLLQAEADREARQKAREVSDFQSLQAHRYASSGITLQGTPLIVMEETRRKGQEEVDAIIARGKAQSELMRAKAKQTRSAGRNAMFGSFLSGIGGGFEAYLMGKRTGIYGSKLNVPDIPRLEPDVKFRG